MYMYLINIGYISYLIFQGQNFITKILNKIILTMISDSYEIHIMLYKNREFQGENQTKRKLNPKNKIN